MSGSHAALRALDRNKEEVELSVRGDCLGVLDKIAVDDATRGRVLQLALVVLDEESLDNPLIDDEKGNLRLGSCLIVALVAGVLELGDLAIDHLGALSAAHTITVDDDVRRQGVLVVLSE